MRITGLEPARGTPLDPKSSASANSAISAYQQMYFITSAVLCQKNIAISIIIELTIFLLNERAGIRTPDNLIKSQVLKVPGTPSFRRFPLLPWTLLGHYVLINCFTV